MSRRKSRYYVVERSNWQGDRWTPISYSMPTRKEAKAKAEELAYHPHRELGGIDIKSEKHTRVMTRTELSKVGYPTTDVGEHRLLMDIDAELQKRDYQAESV